MVINGERFLKMCSSAANALDNNKEDINNLNVFPVPDGDTGINMSLTIKPAREITLKSDSLAECASAVASGVLRSARGNSGAILSLFFRGMSKAFAGHDTADAQDIAEGFKSGTAEAYRAVSKPTEGTILTVMRETAEYAESEWKNYVGKPAEFFEVLVSSAKATLAKTPDMLPLLKEAGVVDAGGQGFVTMLEGMLASLNGQDVQSTSASAPAKTKTAADFSDFDGESINFAYCTECIVGKSDKFRGEGKADKLRTTIAPWGDSMVFIDDEEIIKLHIHTNDPGKVLSTALKYGALETVKIENMKIQHSNLADSSDEGDTQVRISKKYGFVAVCLGEGITDTFRELGVNEIVSGGQTMNPSTEDILNAVRKTEAEYVFVLPNNKNIIMVASQAAEMLEGSGQNVIVLPTKSVPQGMSAMLNFDPDATPEYNEKTMKSAFAKVHTISLTRAVREVKLGGHLIRKDEFLGLLEGKIEKSGKRRDDILLSILGKFNDAEFVTVFYGAAVSDADAEAVFSKMQALIPEAEMNLIPGGQPLYDFVISVE
ncbi:MAG: DAK2 domain-containing protein [Ruminococcaceae bacterium]|nr:DAK2 domain-containing protein [Oscillospiraceae bacterium]